MADLNHIVLKPIGIVRSNLKKRDDCSHQGHEGGINAWLEIDAAYLDGLDAITPECELILLTWFHKAHRDILQLHPRNNPKNAIRGVFTTRSPDRPNPIGLHRIKVKEISQPGRIKVFPLEVLDGTPIIDIKPVISLTDNEQ